MIFCAREKRSSLVWGVKSEEEKAKKCRLFEVQSKKVIGLIIIVAIH